MLTPDVDFNVIAKFGAALEAAVREDGFACEISSLIIYLVILNPEIAAAKNSRFWRKKESSYLIKTNIDFFKWQAASSREKKRLVADAIEDSIERMSKENVSIASKEKLVNIVRSVLETRKHSGSRRASAQQ